MQTWTNRRARYGALWRLKEKLSPPTEFNAHLKYMNEFCWSIIERRSSETEEELSGKMDLLSILLLTNIQKPEAKKDRDEMRDFIMNFLIAGRDTTAVMLTWCVHLLCENPDVYAKLLDEINTVLGDSVEPTWENTKDMRYVKQVLQETLRLYSRAFSLFSTLLALSLSCPLNLRPLPLSLRPLALLSLSDPLPVFPRSLRPPTLRPRTPPPVAFVSLLTSSQRCLLTA